jgi:hypothetical protein
MNWCIGGPKVVIQLNRGNIKWRRYCCYDYVKGLTLWRQNNLYGEVARMSSFICNLYFMIIKGVIKVEQLEFRRVGRFSSAFYSEIVSLL